MDGQAKSDRKHLCRVVKPRRFVWLSAALVALLIQSLYPPGLMPGQLDDGWLASLCPKGLPMGFAHRLGLHGHHSEGHEDNKSLGDCQLGSAVEQPLAETAAVWPDPAFAVHRFASPGRPSALPHAQPRFHDTRAPPESA